MRLNSVRASWSRSSKLIIKTLSQESSERCTRKKEARRLCPSTSSSLSCGYGLDGQTGFRLFNQLSKGRLVKYRDIGQNLAVYLDRGFSQAVHEHTIGHATFASGGINSSNPQGPKLSFLLTAITVGVL